MWADELVTETGLPAKAPLDPLLTGRVGSRRDACSCS
jgi:hypothetical protein